MVAVWSEEVVQRVLRDGGCLARGGRTKGFEGWWLFGQRRSDTVDLGSLGC